MRVEKVPGDEPYVFAVHTMPEHGSVKEEGMFVCREIESEGGWGGMEVGREVHTSL